MSFLKWCQLRFGIISFSNVTEDDNVFLPASVGQELKLTKRMKAHMGRLIDSHEVVGEQKVSVLKGIFIPSSCLERLIELFEIFVTGDTIQKREFQSSGVDYFARVPQRGLNGVYIKFSNQHSGLDLFKKHFGTLCFDEIRGDGNKTTTLSFPALLLPRLINLYYESVVLRRKDADNSIELPELLRRLENFITLVEQQNINPLNFAQLMAWEFYTNPKQLYKASGDMAAQVYALSLNMFTEMYFDIFSDIERRGLYLATDILRSVGPNNQLRHCVESECTYVAQLVNSLFIPYAQQNRPGYTVIENLPDGGRSIFSSIKLNVLNKLYGYSGARDLTRFLSFLPDANMNSETNQLVYQCGELNNFALAMIVKVGFLGDNNYAGPDQTARYYKYYKVEHNFGGGADDRPVRITRIYPCVEIEGRYKRIDINPCTEPTIYQTAMAFTLSNLLEVEQQLLFYRKPNRSLLNHDLTNEEIFWSRLNEMRHDLSGEDLFGPILYFIKDSARDAKPIQITLQSENSIFDKSKFSPLLILKSLVGSLTGSSIAVCHLNFMQMNNGLSVVRLLQEKYQFLRTKINRAVASQPVMPPPVLPHPNAFAAGQLSQARDRFYTVEGRTDLSDRPAKRSALGPT